MRPGNIILIRHGESEGNLDKSHYEVTPDFALKLTPRGIGQAQQAGRTIKELIRSGKIHVYVSPFHRARQTFQYIKAEIENNIVKAIEDPRIREQDWGHLRNQEDNREIAEARDNFSTFYFRIPDGESGADVYDRVSSFLDTLHRDFDKDDFPENVLLVTHGLTIRLFLMRWFHWSVEEFENLHNPKNCQIVVLKKQLDNRYKLVGKLAKKEKEA
jgi:broad specificity phosphatase PhoE